MKLRHHLTGLALACAGALLAGDAAAQPRDMARPLQPGLQMNGSLYGGYDAPLFSNTSLTFQPTSQTFGGGDVRLNYNRPGRKYMLSVTASAANRYHPNFTPSTTPSYGGSIAISSVSRGRWGWGLAQFAQYAPLSAASFFATTGGGLAGGGPIDTSALAAAANQQISPIRQVDVNTSGQISYSVTRRTHVSLSSGVASQVQIDSSQPSAIRYDSRLRLTHEISRSLSAFFGYGLNQIHVPANNGAPGFNARIDTYDFGVNFNRGLQLTRDTTLNFQTGFVKVPIGARNEFQVVGAMSLDHRVSRSWDAQVVVTRDARFVQAYRNPVIFSGASATLGGLIASRVSGGVGVHYSAGKINVPPNPSKFNSASATAQIRFDVRRRAGVFVEYSLFRSKFDANQALTNFPTGSFGRHGVRVGLSLGVNPFARRP